MKWKFGVSPSRFYLGLSLLTALALGLRLWQLEAVPVHTDEAVHAVILGHFLETGEYRYNPVDSHGPTLYYISWCLLRLLGFHSLATLEIWPLRLISALIGAATVGSLAVWRKELGDGATLFAAACLTLSAPFVYYHRAYIHEGLFVWLSLLLLHQTWRWVGNPTSDRSAMICGALGGLLWATKETAVLMILALALAALMLRKSVPTFSRRPLFLASAAFIIVAGLFFSSWGTQPSSLVDAVAALARFFHRAEGEGHEKPWWTYLVWLGSNSTWIKFPPMLWIFYVACWAACFRWKEPTVRFLSFYTLIIGIIYSVIPYKTPWLMLNFLAPLCLLAGVGTLTIPAPLRKWSLCGIVLWNLVFTVLLAEDTWRKCFLFPVHENNSLAYSPTSYDAQNLANLVEAYHPNSPQSLRVQVISEDYWPLPWYLRHLTQVGYWSQIPTELNADVYVTSPALFSALQEKIGPGWRVQYFGLRPEVLALVLTRPAQ